MVVSLVSVNFAIYLARLFDSIRWSATEDSGDIMYAQH